MPVVTTAAPVVSTIIVYNMLIGDPVESLQSLEQSFHDLWPDGEKELAEGQKAAVSRFYPAHDNCRTALLTVL